MKNDTLFRIENGKLAPRRKKINRTAHIAWQIRLGFDTEQLTNQEQLEVAKHLIRQIEEDIEDIDDTTTN